ncbi:MAG: tRNA 2-thiouridine(34) synthase MnmA [Gammaproteobacteria bacterium]|mgnify:CR=1 FL=1|jgi:tRNA-uridine 2-sulfurtransferase|nr:tRNA 2-thiouridine(34) synthase MnmA [Gammaproteobacteria bacterium]
MSDKVIVGISGGVDSSVAALLLKEQGYQIEALFMKNWDEKSEDGSCMWEADVEDAMRVCDTLKIPINTVDLSREYWDGVFTDFLEEYKAGRTPNPDILCNQEVKFKAFLEHSLALGADKIATGHYAQVVHKQDLHLLYKGLDDNKDQSYFLCRLQQAQLARTLFPLGEIAKPRVRELATKAGLITHDKKDSTGICFIGERPFREFLSQYIPVQKGEIRTTEKALVGEHDGVYFYTLGQRQGLGIGGVKGASDEPWYVVAKDTGQNTLIVAQGHDHPLLFSKQLVATGLHWISGQAPNVPFSCQAKTRYRQADQSCTVTALDNKAATVHFDTPQRAVTPGQYVVFYDAKGCCLGSAVIDSTET